MGQLPQFALKSQKEQCLPENESVPSDFSVGQAMRHILKAAGELPAQDLPDLIGLLETAKATAWARITAPTSIQPQHDELLNVTEAARRLGISEDYLYSHHKDYNFTRRQGKKLLFSALGIDRYISQKKS